MDEKLSTEIAKELAPKVYDDLAQPTLQSAGGLLELIPRTIRASLAPLEKWILNKEFQVKETTKLLEKKLEKVSPEQIETPEPYIAVPALQYISYCMDNHELRDMYANLLASSMNKFIKNDVHPGYIEIIKQLCPDEAKILKYIAEKINIPTISLYYGSHINGMKRIIKDFSDVGYLTQCEDPLDIPKYFWNLVRLGLLEIPDSSPSVHSSLSDKQLYEPLKENTYIQTLIKKFNDPNDKNNELDIIEGYASMTDYGIGFCKICLDNQTSSDSINRTAVVDNSEYLTRRNVASDEEFEEMIKDVGLWK